MKNFILFLTLFLLTRITALTQQLNILPAIGKCGIGTLSPGTYLQIHGSTTYELSPPKVVVGGDLPPLLISHLGNSSNLLMTNEVCGKTINDGTMIHQSENDFYISNQESGGRVVLNASGNISLNTNGASFVMEAATKRIYSGGTAFTINSQYAGFNIFASSGTNALNLRAASGNGLSIQTPDNTQALQIFGNSSGDKKFSVSGAGNTFAKTLVLGESSTPFSGLLAVNSGLSSTVNLTLLQVANAEKKLFQIDNQGLLKTRRIIVNQEDWPDYVFEKDYPLMPLNQVSLYIRDHKHLPEVPSAEEIQQEGLDLGEINHLLLRKIEELTLYLIQQEELLQQQGAEIKVIKKQLSDEQ